MTRSAASIGVHLRAMRVRECRHRHAAPRPVLKSITGYALLLDQETIDGSRDDPPVGQSRGERRFAERLGPNSAAKRGSDRTPQTCSAISRALARHRQPRRPFEPASAPAAVGARFDVGKALENWWITCRDGPQRASPRSAAARLRRRRRLPRARAVVADALRAAPARSPNRVPASGVRRAPGRRCCGTLRRNIAAIARTRRRQRSSAPALRRASASARSTGRVPAVLGDSSARFGSIPADHQPLGWRGSCAT